MYVDINEKKLCRSDGHVLRSDFYFPNSPGSRMMSKLWKSVIIFSTLHFMTGLGLGRREQTGAGVINDLKKLVDQEMGRVFITN